VPAVSFQRCQGARRAGIGRAGLFHATVAPGAGIDLTLPLARERNMGVIAKRPIANAAWRHAVNPGGYPQTYWERLQKLRYDFLRGDVKQAASIALRSSAASWKKIGVTMNSTSSWTSATITAKLLNSRMPSE